MRIEEVVVYIVMVCLFVCCVKETQLNPFNVLNHTLLLQFGQIRRLIFRVRKKVGMFWLIQSLITPHKVLEGLIN